jgi:hypothetical protein
MDMSNYYDIVTERSDLRMLVRLSTNTGGEINDHNICGGKSY